MPPRDMSLSPLVKVAGFVALAAIIWWVTFYLSTLCMMYLLIESFWRYLDKAGTIWTELNKNSYYVYIIHVIVIGAIALPLLNLAIPPLLKYLILLVSSYLASNLIVSLYRRAAAAVKAASQPSVSGSSAKAH